MDATGFRKALLPFGIILYLVHMLNTSYSNSFLKASLPINTLWGPFVSVLFVGIGYHLATSNFPMKKWHGIVFTILGLLLCVVESFLKAGDAINIEHIHMVFLFGTIFLTSGISIYLFTKPNLGKGGVFSGMGKYTLGVYACHLVIHGIIKPLSAVLFSWWWGIANYIIVVTLSFGLTMIFRGNDITRKAFL